MLKANGVTNRELIKQLTVENLTIGIAGSAIGLIAGLTFTKYLLSQISDIFFPVDLHLTIGTNVLIYLVSLVAVIISQFPAFSFIVKQNIAEVTRARNA